MKSYQIVLTTLVIGQLVLADSIRPMEKSGRSGLSFVEKMINGVVDFVRPSPHIIGGWEVFPHSHPYQVALRIEKDLDIERVCGGSLISPDWVLTAAHCTDNTIGITAFLGSHNISAYESSRQIREIKECALSHPRDLISNFNDIALLKLEYPAVFDRFVQPIRLPALSLRNKSLNLTPVELMGWGKTRDTHDFMSSVLRSAKTTVASHRHCEMHFTNIRDTHICAYGAQGVAVCRGDSGGPMVMTEADGQRTLIGITSFGSENGCESRAPTVFTRVDAYLGWISETTGIRLRI